MAARSGTNGLDHLARCAITTIRTYAARRAMKTMVGAQRPQTPDLLRVKPDPGFFWLRGFHCVLCLFNRLGSLLFAQSASSTASTDGVLIRF
jgi:hypothetical protein